jgi:type II secretory pathway pseudopilin PulG
LIEVLVVLALLAALLAVAFPEFSKLYASVALSTERGDVERQLLELPQAVRAAGRGGVLFDPEKDADDGLIAAAGPAVADLEASRPLHLDLPHGWRLSVPRPIRYHFTGACDGGEVILSRPPLSLRYVLTPPLCRPQIADARSP